MIPEIWFQEAQKRISPYIRQTPLTYDPELDIFIKWENHQVTGSFKVRGALNKILTLSAWERDQGIVAASAGNHGQGVALASKLTGASAIIFASEHAAPVKLEAMRQLGADVRLVPGGYGEAEASGLAHAKLTGSTWVSPYNDGQIIAGQGTIGLETIQQLEIPGSYTWIMPVGGGGLLSGIGMAINSGAYESSQATRQHKLIGSQSTNSKFMHHLFYQSTQEGVQDLPSLADGLSGPVETNSVTIPIVRKLAEAIVLVTEDEIQYAIKYAWDRFGERIEGSAAAALAAISSGQVSKRPAVVIITGGNIQPEIHNRIISGDPGLYST